MLNEYLSLLLFAALCGTVALGMLVATSFLGPKRPSEEKRMPFESGADSAGAQGFRLSVKFYLTAILFVIVDIEVAFLYPWAVLMQDLGWRGLISMGLFATVIGTSLVYAWKKGALEWER